MKRKTDLKVFAFLLVLTALLTASQPVLSATALSKGSKGSEVRRLQERLTELGFEPGKADGVYGNATYLAVLLFQSRNGLDMDGAAGSATLNLLYSENAQGKVKDDLGEKPYVTQDGLPLLVNLNQSFPDGYVYYDLVVMNQYCDQSIVKIKYDNMLAEKEAVDALLSMLQAAKQDGIRNWQISAACRTVTEQKRLMNSRVNSYVKNGMSKKKAQSAARQTVAEPGCSEHHLGLAFDITAKGASGFKGTKQCKWLHAHCWEYGFIVRYPEGKQDITGFAPEAWHVRYTGVEHSLLMRDEDLCLEEYLEKYGPAPDPDALSDEFSSEEGSGENVP